MNKSTNDKIEKAFFLMRRYAVILLSIIISASGQQLTSQKKKEIFLQLQFYLRVLIYNLIVKEEFL
jgi:hypothetical protein